MDGFVNLYKPQGITSHDAVYKLRKIYGIKKIGHTGTLDPMAEGVLSMCVGAATRAAEFLENDDKTYRCEIQLGLYTDTGDIWGRQVYADGTGYSTEIPATDGRINPVTDSRIDPAGIPVPDISENDLKTAILSMIGTQDQYPPMYSAVRKNGRHLYEYAREGKTVEVEPRRITIHDIRIISIYDKPGRAVFDIDCSKGTYIRTVCTDIGEKLGCGAVMSALVRTRSGDFRVEDAVTLDELAASDDPSAYLIPVDTRLSGLGAVRLDEAEHTKYINGGKIAERNAGRIRENNMPDDSRHSDIYLVYGPAGFAGTARYSAEHKIYTAHKVLFR